jgi:hypothetical protein
MAGEDSAPVLIRRNYDKAAAVVSTTCVFIRSSSLFKDSKYELRND